MRTGLEIVCVTPGAVGLILCEAPGVTFGIALVTIAAHKVTSMALRVGSRAMSEYIRAPLIRPVTDGALLIGNKVV